MGQKRGKKNQKPWAGEDVFLVHPQNSLNGLILNWCAGGCWFTPAKIGDILVVPLTDNLLGAQGNRKRVEIEGFFGCYPIREPGEGTRKDGDRRVFLVVPLPENLVRAQGNR